MPVQRCAKKPTYVILGGYETSLQVFKAFVKSLTKVEAFVSESPDKPLTEYLAAYHRWRNQFPKKVKHTLPKLRPRYSSKDHKRGPDRFFFPVRWIHSTRREQPNKSSPGLKVIQTENQDDRAKLAAFVEFVSLHGGKLDPATVAFTYMKDYC